MIKQDPLKTLITDALEELSNGVNWMVTAQAEINECCGLIARFRANRIANSLGGMLRCVANVLYEISENPDFCVTAEMSEMICRCLDRAPVDLFRFCDLVPVEYRSIENIYYTKRRFSRVCKELQEIIRDAASQGGEG